MAERGNPELLKDRGNAQKARGDLEAAVESYRLALAIAPDYTAARYNLGLTLRELNRLEEAEAQFRQIHEQDPRDVDALFNLADLLSVQARYSESLAHFRAAIKLAPDNPYLSLQLALVERRVPGHELQVLDHHEEQPEGREELHEDRQGPGAESSEQEQPRIEHRARRPQFPPDERHHGQQPDGQRRQGDRLAPAALGPFDDGKHRRRDGDHGQQRPADVETAGVGIHRARYER